jgi:type IV pilus assembly protein PilE
MTKKISMARGSASGSHRRKGFTLIELVVAMVIAAILAAIAIPGYSSYVRKSRRTDAKTALLDLASLEERFFSTQNYYSATATDLGYTAWPATIGSGYYQISAPVVVAAVAPTTLAPAGSPATFSITAVPVPTNDQAKDTQCTSFTVTSGGGQSALSGTTDATQTCWR